jgi:hypothetical protein
MYFLAMTSKGNEPTKYVIHPTGAKRDFVLKLPLPQSALRQGHEDESSISPNAIAASWLIAKDQLELCSEKDAMV